MKKNETVITARKQGSPDRKTAEPKGRGLKVRTNIKAGAGGNPGGGGDGRLAANHNETVAKSVSTKRDQAKQAKTSADSKARGLKVRTNVKAGAPGDPPGKLGANHNETLAH